MTRKQNLGASLYVPANHPDLAAIANGDKLGHLRSVIFCTEDAVAERELPLALASLAETLAAMDPQHPAMRFVRVRSPEVLAEVLAMPGVENLSGFVLPKCTRSNFPDYFSLLEGTRHLIMPTLETVEVFDDQEMQSFRRYLEAPEIRERILALRIGGNDLLALLGIRRPRNMSIYRTPLGPVISRLVVTFRPYGFALTAPVFEHLDNPALLDDEICEDLAHGMVGKTAIHPEQVALIERHYRVKTSDIEMAQRIIDAQSPAVFQMHGSMCEVATHRDWAKGVVEQALVFGMAH
jgi:citrate lyase beta subunit